MGSVSAIKKNKRAQCNVFNIPPSVPFLPTLVDALLDGQLIDGWKPSDPLELSTATIFLPTRRATRELAQVLREKFGGSVLLPDIRALGDAQDDGGFLSGELSLTPLALDPVVSPLERRLLLGRQILAWRRAISAEHINRMGEASWELPSSSAEAVNLAGDLAQLMDQMETEELDWSKLLDLLPDGSEFLSWWDVTLQFLQIATATWPKILGELKQNDPAVHRRNVLDHLAAKCQAHALGGSNTGPVIAAGSTGSIPATARLLRAISQLPQGVVVLPGLDQHIDQTSWSRIGRLGAKKFEPSHAQYALRALLSDDPNDPNKSTVSRPVLPATRMDVLANNLGKAAPKLAAREKLASELMRPASSTEFWAPEAQDQSMDFQAALEGVCLCEADDVQAEALAIALSMREVLQTAQKTAALVTPDRVLARRVAAELRRFDVHVDDSAGTPLKQFPQASLLSLVLQWCCGDDHDSRLVLVSLLKHPLVSLGLSTAQARRIGRLLELAVLRGSHAAPIAGRLEQFVADIAASSADDDRAHRTKRGLTPTDWQEVLDIARRLDEASAPLSAAHNEKASHSVSNFAQMSAQAIETFSATSDMPFGGLYEGEAGEVLAQSLRSLVASDAAKNFIVSTSEWPSLCATLVEGAVVRPNNQLHPRLRILGPLEARLVPVDRIILGGLNEDSWPQIAKNDPFLSRLMKQEMGLEPPERRIGQSAHDFFMCFCAPEIFLTRSLRQGEAPSVASRWLQRLAAVIGEKRFESLGHKGAPYLQLAMQLLDSNAPAAPCAPPKPCPPTQLRPKRIGFSEVETLIRDPYAIYAKRILGLRPLDPLIYEPNARDEGTILHEIFANFIRAKKSANDADAFEYLAQLAEDYFNDLNLSEELRAFWEPRFHQIAEEFLIWQAQYAQALISSHAEVSGELSIWEDYRISGVADRIDVTQSGLLRVLDYKGSSPPYERVKNLSAPQLALEAHVVSKGGFKGIAAAEVEDLMIVRLKPDFGKHSLLGGNKAPLAMDLADAAWSELVQLTKLFAKQSHPYSSRRRPARDAFVSDYDHLSRNAEWSAVFEVNTSSDGAKS